MIEFSPSFPNNRGTKTIGLTNYDEFLGIDIATEGGDRMPINVNHAEAHALADWIKENVPVPAPAWHSAKPGEVWELTVNFFDEGVSQPRAAAYIEEDRHGNSAFWFTDSDTYVHRTDDGITSGRRIWPEEAS